MKVAVYVSPTIYNDTGLATAIDKYGKAVEQELGWSVHKKKLEEYKDWKKVRSRVMNDGYNCCVFVGTDIDYPLLLKKSTVDIMPVLVPLASNAEPNLTADGRVKVDMSRYTADRAVTMLWGTVEEMRNAFLKFSNRNVGGYKTVRLFYGYDASSCEKKADVWWNIPPEYDAKFFVAAPKEEYEAAKKSELSFLSVDGHGSPEMVSICPVTYPWYYAYASHLVDKKIRMLKAAGCYVTTCYFKPARGTWASAIVENPYLHLVFAGGYGASCGRIDKYVIPKMLRGKTYAEAFLGTQIDQYFTMFGDPTFHLRPGSEEAPPSAPPPVTPPPPKKSVITFKSVPTGAGIWIKKT